MSHILTQLGLTSNETQVYLEFQKSGSITAAQVARNLKFDKSSTYRAVESLEKQQLLIKHPKTKGTTYEAANPERFQFLIKTKQLELKQQINDLSSFIEKIKQSNQASRHTFITVEKGMQAHINVMEKSLNNSEGLIRERWQMVNPIFNSKYYQDYVYKFFKRRLKLNIFDKYLATFSPDINPAFSSITDTSQDLKKEVRILPPELHDTNHFRIFDHTTEIISFDSKDDFIVITIQDQWVTELMKQMFNFIWNRSETYHKPTK